MESDPVVIHSLSHLGLVFGVPGSNTLWEKAYGLFLDLGVVTEPIKNTEIDNDEYAVEVRQVEYGRGLFALKDFEEDEFMYPSINDQVYCLYSSPYHSVHIGPNIRQEGISYDAFVNHECERGNCYLKNTEEYTGANMGVFATRSIKKGDQIFWCYSLANDYNWTEDCYCGLPICTGKMGDFKNCSQEYINLSCEKQHVYPFIFKQYKKKE
eukprot:TRINITY_DN2555_c0_g1_i2.p1 TRINITY_DN2555_c0_g1~~TRINITY_DN2555_c0_g1_i2.p1  ORF type:complete len:211 (-),score=37.83 TRINITY_DN2555_c0_g1_i2:5-637(-)